MARTIAWLAVALILPGCAGNQLVFEDDGALAVIPLRTGESGHILVETTLNGQGPFEFALDTGASISVVFEQATAKASIEATSGEVVRVLGMTSSGSFPLAEVSQIGVGGEVWNAARVAVLPENSPVADAIDGILGVDFLSQYAVLYSHEERVVRLYPKELVREKYYDGWNRVDLYELQIGDAGATIYAFDMIIESTRIPTLFDLGASVNLMNRRAARSIGIRTPKPREKTDIWGAFGRAIVTTELIVWQLQITNMHWRHRTFLIGDFPVFDALGLNRMPAAIAGTDLFRKRDFVIDFVGKRLLVKSKE